MVEIFDVGEVIQKLEAYRNGKLDIRFNRPSPLCELSNLWPRRFKFRGLECNSIEGVLASLFAPTWKREEIVKLSGFEAFYAIDGFRVRNFMFFDGYIDRFSKEYGDFLYDLYYSAFSQCDFSKEILVTTSKFDIELVHSVGKSGKQNTILTESEYITTLNNVRMQLTGDEYEEEGILNFGRD